MFTNRTKIIDLADIVGSRASAPHWKPPNKIRDFLASRSNGLLFAAFIVVFPSFRCNWADLAITYIVIR